MQIMHVSVYIIIVEISVCFRGVTFNYDSTLLATAPEPLEAVDDVRYNFLWSFSKQHLTTVFLFQVSEDNSTRTDGKWYQ